MADLKTNIELDDERFRRAAKRVANQSSGMGKAMERAFRTDAGRSMDELVGKFATLDFAVQTVMRGMRAAAQAVSSYREEFPGMTGNINSVDAALGRLQTSIGRDLSLAIDSSAGDLAGIIDTFDELRRGMVDLVASGMGADVQGVNEAVALAERQDELNRQNLAVEELRRKRVDQVMAAEEARARAAGEHARAEEIALERRLQAITDEATAQKQAVGEMELSRSHHAAAVQFIDETSLAKRVMAQREYTRAVEQEDARRAEAAEKAAQETERVVEDAMRFARQLQANADREQQSRQLAAETLQDRQAQRNIEVQMLEGKRREAEMAQLELRFAREKRDIERDEMLTSQQKAQAIARLAQDQERITSLTMQRIREEREGRSTGVMGGTLAGGRAQGQQLGVRAQQQTADATAKTAEGVQKVLDQFAQAIRLLGTPPTATFGA